MPKSTATENGTRRRKRAWAGVSAIVAVALVTLVATAFGASSALTLSSASNSTLGKRVLVNPQGRTLYMLTPETTKHLLCKSKECLANWPPVLVKSAKTKLKASGGVQGKLGVFRRSNGTFQVTLRGLPVYRYSGDSAKGQANGEGIESFGGVWHAVAASTSSSGTSTTPTMSGTTSTPSTTTPSAPSPTPAPTPTATTPAPSPPSEPYKY